MIQVKETLVILTLSFCVLACDRKKVDHAHVKTAAGRAEQVKPSATDDETAAVESFKPVVEKLAQRYSQKEIKSPTQSDTLPLDVVVPRESISVKRTGDLVRPFRGEACGSATLDVPASWFNDNKPRTLLYDVVWPFNYKDGRWSSDKLSCEPNGGFAHDAILESLSEVVRMRIIMWDRKK